MKISLKNINKQSPVWMDWVSRTGLALVGAMALAKIAGYDLMAFLTPMQTKIFTASVTGFYFFKLLVAKPEPTIKESKDDSAL